MSVFEGWLRPLLGARGRGNSNVLGWRPPPYGSYGEYPANADWRSRGFSWFASRAASQARAPPRASRPRRPRGGKKKKIRRMTAPRGSDREGGGVGSGGLVADRGASTPTLSGGEGAESHNVGALPLADGDGIPIETDIPVETGGDGDSLTLAGGDLDGGDGIRVETWGEDEGGEPTLVEDVQGPEPADAAASNSTTDGDAGHLQPLPPPEAAGDVTSSAGAAQVPPDTGRGRQAENLQVVGCLPPPPPPNLLMMDSAEDDAVVADPVRAPLTPLSPSTAALVPPPPPRIIKKARRRRQIVLGADLGAALSPEARVEKENSPPVRTAADLAANIVHVKQVAINSTAALPPPPLPAAHAAAAAALPEAPPAAAEPRPPVPSSKRKREEDAENEVYDDGADGVEEVEEIVPAAKVPCLSPIDVPLDRAVNLLAENGASLVYSSKAWATCCREWAWTLTDLPTDVPADQAPYGTLTALNEYTDEYRRVVDGFHNTCRNKGFRVQRVMRVTNTSLLRVFQEKKAALEAQCGEIAVMRMYHGTPRDNIVSICDGNLDLRLAGTNSNHKWWGTGVNFSPISYYASHYGDKGPERSMIVCDVLLGRVCSIRRPPEAPLVPDGQGQRYDTNIKLNPSPQVVCKFDDNQYYPSYVIDYVAPGPPQAGPHFGHRVPAWQAGFPDFGHGYQNDQNDSGYGELADFGFEGEDYGYGHSVRNFSGFGSTLTYPVRSNAGFHGQGGLAYVGGPPFKNYQHLVSEVFETRQPFYQERRQDYSDYYWTS